MVVGMNIKFPLCHVLNNWCYLLICIWNCIIFWYCHLQLCGYPFSGSSGFAFIQLLSVQLTLVLTGYLTIPVTLVWWVLLGDDVYLVFACGAFDDQFLGLRYILRFAMSSCAAKL